MPERTASAAFVRWAAALEPAPIPGVRAAALAGEQLSGAVYALEGGAVVPEHAHDSEELGHVLRGSLELSVAGETSVVGEGEAFLIPGGVPHAARAPAGGCELLECYAPPRAPASSPPTEATP